MDIVVLDVPRLLRRRGRKTRTLVWNACRLLQPTCLVAAERTSTVIKSFPLPMPVMVHIPHGAGDRAKGFEARIARFDHVIVAGPKDRRRMIAAGVVTPDTCSVSGYIKTAAVRRISPEPARLFGTEILRAFAGQDRFNLIFIFAPKSRP